MPAAVYILDADPDLADLLDPETLAQARPYAVARVGEAEPGEWDPLSSHTPQATDLGLLILSGVTCREVHVAGRSATEVLGDGDLLRPWDPENDALFVAPTVDWTVLAPLRFAILDARFALVAARWPRLMSALMARAVRRSRALTYHLAVTQITGVETRVLMVLWEFAQRWGHVRPEGVALNLRVTHEMLARLVGARRPSVTSALRTLNDEGRITQEGPGRWLLLGTPPESSATIEQALGSLGRDD